MSWVKNVTDPSEVVNKGDEVEAIVLSVQKEEAKFLSDSSRRKKIHGTMSKEDTRLAAASTRKSETSQTTELLSS